MAGNSVIGALRVDLGINTAQFQDGLRGAQKSLGRIGKRLQSVGQDLSVRVSAPLAAIGGLSLKAFSDFEKGLIGVGKTTDIAGDQLADLGRGVQELAREVPVATTELLGIAQAAGQLGVTGTDNILRFTSTVGKLGIASNLSGEAAATALARILTVTNESMGDVDRLGSTIVRLGNNFAATESEIAEAATRVGQATSQFGIAASDVVGIGAALTAVGVKAEAGGTVIGRAFQSINDAVRQGGEELQAFVEITGRSATELQQMFEENPTQAFQALVEGLGRINDEGGDVTSALASVGLSGVRVVQVLGTLATRSDVLGDALNQANTEWRENAALNREAAVATESFAAQTQLARNALSAAATALGRELAPAANQLLSALAGLARWFSQLNPEVLKFGAIAGGIAAAVGPALVVIGSLSIALGALATPIGLVISGLAALTIAVIAFWDDVEPTVSVIGAGFAHLWQGIINDIERVKRAFQSLQESTRQTLDVLSNMVDRVDELMGGRLTKAFELPKRGAQGLVDTIRGMAREIVGNSIVPDMVDAIEQEFQRLDTVMAQQSEQAVAGVENAFTGLGSTAQGVGEDMSAALQSTTRSALGNLTNALRSGETGWQRYANIAINALNRIVDKLLNDVLDAIFQVNSASASGGGGGGFFGSLLSGITGLFGGGSGGGGFLGGGVGRVPVGFQHGGSFTVGGAAGIDRNLVQFRATRGERVDVTPAGQRMGEREGGGGGNTFIIDNSNSTAESYAELKRALLETVGPGKFERRAVNAVVDARQRNPRLFGPRGGQ